MDIYKINNIKELIKGNSYVGRGIIIGKSEDSKRAVIAYFIMGRSENSRNRVFIKEGDNVMIKPFDEDKVEDPSLIIYYPIRVHENNLIVTNGDQTDTIYQFMIEGNTFEESLKTRCFEPDAPNLTPRISSMITYKNNNDFSYKMNILKSGDAKGTVCNRYNFDYDSLPGLGHFLHTYMQDGTPIPTFQGEPERVFIPNDINTFSNEIWDNLDEDNKISLYVRYTDLKDGSYEDKMINKNK